MLGSVIETIFGEILATLFAPKSKWGIAILYTVFGLMVAAFVYFGWLHGET